MAAELRGGLSFGLSGFTYWSHDVGGFVRPVPRDLYRRCRALVYPGREDFGIVPVEAQSCGAPIIAVAAGGALDTVVDGRSGVLYASGAGEITRLAGVLRNFDDTQFDGAVIANDAQRFSPVRFRRELAAAVQATV